MLQIEWRIKDKIRNLWAEYLVRKSEYFNEEWYRLNCAERIKDHEDAAKHYINGGWKISDPSKYFSNEAYIEHNPDIQASNLAPLEHYVLYGQREGRALGIHDEMKLANAGAYHAHRLRRTISRQIWRLACANRIRKNKKARILVCVQLFYPKSWGEVEQYLKSLKPYDCDYVFTYQSEPLFAQIIKEIKKRWPKAKFCHTLNNGFDIGSFYESLKDIDLNQYDIVFKLHTKGTHRRELSMYNQYFKRRDWLIYLFEGILGSRTVHRTIDLLMNNANCGLVAAENLLVADPRHKVNMLRKAMSEIEPPIDVPENYKYVAGTCFACKAVLLKGLQQRELDFTPSKRGFFSLAHSIERAMCFPMQQNGFMMYGNKVCTLRRAIRRLQGRGKRYPARERLLADTRFDLNDEFVYRSVETAKIVHYELKPMRLGDIRRKWFDGVVYRLKDCAPYKYLMGDDSVYEEYSQFHEKHNLPPMTRERFDQLIKSLDQNGYNERMVVVVDQDDIILDGQHRACYLLQKYGENHVIKCLKLYKVRR